MFGKNKDEKKVEANPEAEAEAKAEPTEVIDVNLSENKQEETTVKSKLKELEKYFVAFTPQDVVNSNQPTLESHRLNLLFAIFSELSEIKQLLKEK